MTGGLARTTTESANLPLKLRGTSAAMADPIDVLTISGFDYYEVVKALHNRGLRVRTAEDTITIWK